MTQLTFKKGEVFAWFTTTASGETLPGLVCNELPFGIIRHAARHGMRPRQIWNLTHRESGCSAGHFRTLKAAKAFLQELSRLRINWDFGVASGETFVTRIGSKPSVRRFLAKHPERLPANVPWVSKESMTEAHDEQASRQ